MTNTANEQFARDVVHGLSGSPRTLDSRYLYDTRGSELFDAICQQPEYYLTQAEDEILESHAAEIAQRVGASTLIELGSGNSNKTHHLLRAFTAAHGHARYIPVDVSLSALEASRRGILDALEGVTVTPFEGSYEDAHGLAGDVSTPLVVFLGSTLGNFDRQGFEEFWLAWAKTLSRGAHFLVGVDLHKDTAILEAAYNDAAGVTANFTLNLFARMNRELGTNIDSRAIEHVARYSEARRQIEIFAQFSESQDFDIKLDDETHSFSLKCGQKIRTEVSRKFELDTLSTELKALGFATIERYTDNAARFGTLLLKRSDHVS